MESFYSKVAGSKPIKNSKIFQSTYFKERLWTTSTPAINPACPVSGEETLLIYMMLVLEDQPRQFTGNPACPVSGEETLLIYMMLVLEDQPRQFTGNLKYVPSGHPLSTCAYVLNG